ncbi:MAG: hypothetical protein NZ581_09070, partial [Candidatus Caldarchaeum sp.]|nr:hypothetical protein [Candidatus Caldarchaeum sp.]MDW8436323.1 hypothetical protein [Candidatus Caldarchaeum sp.]
MVNDSFTVKLLPHGTLGRELVITALSPLASSPALGGTSLQIGEEEATVIGQIYDLKQIFQDVLQLLQIKSSLPKIKSHFNDRQVMSKILRKLKLRSDDSYVDYAAALCSWAVNDIGKNPEAWLHSLRTMNVSTKSINLGEPGLAFSGL